MGLVVDTSALVELERRGSELSDVLSLLEGTPIALPAIVLAELLVGVRLARTPDFGARRRAKVDALTARVAVVDFDDVIAEHWADLYAELRSVGGLISATISPWQRRRAH